MMEKDMWVEKQIKSLRIVSHGAVAVVEWDLPESRVNKLSLLVLEELKGVLRELKKSPFKAAVFISRKKGIFVAGADVQEIKNIKSNVEFEKASKMGHDIFNLLEKIPMPIVMAIEGACLGGGLELALAGHYRIASDHPKTQIGLPEVKLGLIPGFGGCYRLPRLIGFSRALRLITTGQSLNAKKAQRMGVVDECVPSAILEKRAIEVAESFIKKGKPKRKFWPVHSMTEKLFHSWAGRKVAVVMAKKAILKQTKNFYPAPMEALAVVSQVYGKSLQIGCLRERKGFVKVANTSVSRHLIDLFFLTEKRKKAKALVGATEEPYKVKRVGVLGAGVMGGSISFLAADKNLSVRMKDVQEASLAKGFQVASEIWSKKVKRRRLTSFQQKEKMAHLSPTLSYSGFENLDFVIEAIVEDAALKKKVFLDLGQHLSESCIVATNTSSLSVTDLASSYKRPENFVGLHFFNPAHRMPLVEVIKGEKTSSKAVITAFELAKKLGKFPVVVKDSPGFLVNRLLLPLLSEALFFLEEGMDLEKVDHLYTYKFGFPMGLYRLMDEVGLDVCMKVLKIFQKNLGGAFQCSELCDEKALGSDFLGRKTSKGFYLYDDKGKPQEVNKDLLKRLGAKSSQAPASNCFQRGLYCMINEASKVLLEEYVVQTPEEVDLAMIMGAGFPPFRGGLLKYADSLGMSSIVSELEEFSSFLGKRFKPSKSLLDMANKQKTFYSS